MYQQEQFYGFDVCINVLSLMQWKYEKPVFSNVNSLEFFD